MTNASTYCEVDFLKVFGSNLETLWKIVSYYRILLKIVNIVKVLYQDIVCVVWTKCG